MNAPESQPVLDGYTACPACDGGQLRPYVDSPGQHDADAAAECGLCEGRTQADAICSECGWMVFEGEIWAVGEVGSEDAHLLCGECCVAARRAS